MTDDVVAELDAELALIEPLPYRVPIHHLAQRARDEIVALRASLDRYDRLVIQAVVVATPAIRAEALEEAAQMCFRANPQSNPNAMGHAIRALKERSDEQ